MKIFEIALELGLELMKKMPNYDQKKKEQYFELMNEYNREKSDPDRDDDKMLNLHNELETFLIAFRKEIQG